MKKKLFLNKQTITQLNYTQQQQVKGGETLGDSWCIANCLTQTIENSEAGPDCNNTGVDPSDDCGGGDTDPYSENCGSDIQCHNTYTCIMC